VARDALRRLPARLRVVLATREEPALGLHRLRLVGELAELRGPDLRFSLEEPRSLLRAGGITLSDTGLDSLQERTEGWPAGLRLAAISLTTHPDPERFVSEFSGSERTVAGHLLAEVLERQPPEVRDLLLRTSILARVSGPLADAVTGGTGAEATLQRLEHQNAFVTALPSNLTAAAIASELVVSTNTVRTRMRHIYGKLDAHSRSEAVARARELGLVAPGAVRR
jgi:LuxR family transcriptional regulator, maltose regulon positive regulatory protein